jgi:FMN phosphatase YigB (HAD superfamily)
VLLIGDSLSSDIAGGKNYGIDTCWFNPGEDADPADLKINYKINSIADLKTFL